MSDRESPIQLAQALVQVQICPPRSSEANIVSVISSKAVCSSSFSAGFCGVDRTATRACFFLAKDAWWGLLRLGEGILLNEEDLTVFCLLADGQDRHARPGLSRELTQRADEFVLNRVSG